MERIELGTHRRSLGRWVSVPLIVTLAAVAGCAAQPTAEEPVAADESALTSPIPGLAYGTYTGTIDTSDRRGFKLRYAVNITIAPDGTYTLTRIALTSGAPSGTESGAYHVIDEYSRKAIELRKSTLPPGNYYLPSIDVSTFLGQHLTFHDRDWKASTVLAAGTTAEPPDPFGGFRGPVTKSGTTTLPIETQTWDNGTCAYPPRYVSSITLPLRVSGTAPGSLTVEVNSRKPKAIRSDGTFEWTDGLSSVTGRLAGLSEVVITSYRSSVSFSSGSCGASYSFYGTARVTLAGP